MSTPFSSQAPRVFSLLFGLLTLALALDLSTEYENGPIPFEDNVDLYFTIDINASTADLAVKLQDSDLVSSQSSANWIGIGVSESTSGSMLGADISTAEFAPGSLDECKFTDRYVPFYAFPLIEARPGIPSAFPLQDECQNDGSWELVRCERDVETGEMILEVTRSLGAHDKQDREIGSGLQNIIYAAGGGFRYHRAKRASTRLILYQEDGGTERVGQAEPDLPDDIDEDIMLTATDYLVPPEFTTTYGCTSKRIKLKKGEKKMIVASEPVLNASVQMVHHLTMYLCRGEEYADMTEKTVECGTGRTGVTGPNGNPKAECVTFVGGYAKGAGRLVLPLNAGILVDEEEYILIMETHYDNPKQLENVMDSSGMRVFLTSTLRKDEAGTMMIGDPTVSLAGEPVESRKYEFSCPAECTQRLPNSVKVYASLLHTHTTAREIYTNKLAPNGSFIENFNKVNFWSDNFQVLKMFDPPKQIAPGDHLQMTCLFDTSKRPSTKFGGATSDEMCMDFIGYYPVERDPKTGSRVNICAFVKVGADASVNGTLCGDLADGFENIFVTLPNPTKKDTFGAPTDFGEKNGTCRAAPVGPGETDEPNGTEPTGGVGGGGPRQPGVTAAPGESPDATPAETVPATDAPTGSPSASPDDDNVCFPASASVTLASGGTKRMSELAIGDSVLVGADEFSQVFMFTHKARDAVHKFVALQLGDGRQLSLTHGHYLYLNGRLGKAGDAAVGDVVKLGDGSAGRIDGVGEHWARGLYNPQTMHGDIVVDGVVTSTYTQSVQPAVAHGLLAPLRWLFRACGVDASPIVVRV